METPLETSLKHVCLDAGHGDEYPCVLERWHEAEYHQASDGFRWINPPKPPTDEPVFVPETRTIQGGYVLEAAHPSVGEPNWKAEAGRLAGQVVALQGARHRTAEVLAQCRRARNISGNSVYEAVDLANEARDATNHNARLLGEAREELAHTRRQRDACWAERDSLREDFQLARESHAGTLAMFDDARVEVERKVVAIREAVEALEIAVNATDPDTCQSNARVAWLTLLGVLTPAEEAIPPSRSAS